MSIGFQVLERARKVGDEWVARYREVPVANVSDSMNRLTAGGRVCVRCTAKACCAARP